MSFVQRDNDVNFRMMRCTPTGDRRQPPPPKLPAPHNAFKSSPRKPGPSKSRLAKTAKLSTTARQRMPLYNSMGDTRRERLEGIAGVKRVPAVLPGNRPPMPPKPPSYDSPNKLVQTHIGKSPGDTIRDIRAARARGNRSVGKKSRTPNLIHRGTFGMTNDKLKDVMKTKDAPRMPKRSITPKKIRNMTMPPQRAGTADPTERTIRVKQKDDLLSIVKDHDYQGVQGKDRFLPSKKLWRKGTPSLKTVKHAILDPREGYEGKPKPKPKKTRLGGEERKIPEKIYRNTSPILTTKVNNVKHSAEELKKKDEMNSELMRKVFNMLDGDRSGQIDAAELQRGLEMLQVDSTIGSIKSIMKKAGHGIDGTIDFNTFSEYIGGQMRGGHIGQMRNARTTFKDANREHRISNIYTAKPIGDLRGTDYNNTSLFANGYTRFKQSKLYKPHLPEHMRRPPTKTKNVYDKKDAKWIKRAMSRATGKPADTISIDSISNPSALKKQLENEKRITKLRRQLNQGGVSPEKKQGLRWGGENRFHAANRITAEREEQHRLNAQQKIEEANEMNIAMGVNRHGIFENPTQIQIQRKKVNRTPSIYTKMIAGDYQHI